MDPSRARPVASLLEQLALGAVPAPDRAVAGEADAAAPVVDAAVVNAIDRAGERFAAARGDTGVHCLERVGRGTGRRSAVEEAAAAERVEGPVEDGVGDRIARVDGLDGVHDGAGGGFAARD